MLTIVLFVFHCRTKLAMLLKRYNTFSMKTFIENGLKHICGRFLCVDYNALHLMSAIRGLSKNNGTTNMVVFQIY